MSGQRHHQASQARVASNAGRDFAIGAVVGLLGVAVLLGGLMSAVASE